LPLPQEERFTRKKHDARFPENAVRYCLSEVGASLGDVDVVAFYDKPFLKFERLLETYLAFAPRGFASFRQSDPDLASRKAVPEGPARTRAQTGRARFRLG
jgi:carbamoyltransferase